MNLNEKIIKNKVGLLNLAEELGNVSRACKVMGFSRDTFYRYKAAVEDGGVEALLDKSRKNQITKIELIRLPKMLSLSLQLIFRPMAS